MHKIAIQLKETSQPIEHAAINTYEKGGFYCVYTEDELVYKYPTQNIFRVIENYGAHGMKDDYDDMIVDAEVNNVCEANCPPLCSKCLKCHHGDCNTDDVVQMEE